MTFPNMTQAAFSVTPGLEIGVTQALAPDSLLRAYLRTGISISPQNVWTVATQFAAAPAGLDPILG